MLTGTNFNTNGTKLYFDPPGSRVTFRVRGTNPDRLPCVVSPTSVNVNLVQRCSLVASSARYYKEKSDFFSVEDFCLPPFGDIVSCTPVRRSAALWCRSTRVDVVGNSPRLLLLQVLSSTRIALFVKSRSSYATVAPEPLKITAIDSGAGVVQINPEDGGLTTGSIFTAVEDVNEQASSDQRARTRFGFLREPSNSPDKK